MVVGFAALALSFTVISPDIRIITVPASMVALLAGSLTYYWLDWDWRNDVYIISDDTITLVHKRPFFLQNLRDQILVERIDNVESISTGLLAALLKYGDVSMSLVGADEPKRFVKVSNPQAVQQEISRRQHKRAQRRARYDAMQQQQMLGEYLGISAATSDTMTPRQRAAMGAAVGGLVAGSNHTAFEAHDSPSIQTAHNPDRNRPPRLPRKTQAPLQAQPVSPSGPRRQPPPAALSPRPGSLAPPHHTRAI